MATKTIFNINPPDTLCIMLFGQATPAGTLIHNEDFISKYSEDFYKSRGEIKHILYFA